MPLPYRAVLRLDAKTRLVPLIEQEVQSWLETRKKVDEERRVGFVNEEFFRPGIHPLAAGRTLSVARQDEAEDGSQSVLLRFTEKNDVGLWQVDVLAIDVINSARKLDMLLVEATRIDDPDAPGIVDPPVLVTQLLGRETVLDSRTPVTDSPRRIGVDEVDLVFDALVDEQRSVSVVAAASQAADLTAGLQSAMQKLTRKLVGTAAVFVLTPEAAKALNERLPSSHALERGRVRTYMTDVNLEDPADGRRHRVLGPETFARAINGKRVARGLQDAFAVQTRNALSVNPLPSQIRRHKRALDEALAKSALDAKIEELVTEPREPATQRQVVGRATELAPTILERMRSFVSRWLDRDVDDVALQHLEEVDVQYKRIAAVAEAVTAELGHAQIQISQLEEQRENTNYEVEYRELELADAEAKAEKLEDETRRLRRALAKHGGGAEAYSVPPEDEWKTPEDLGELALLLTESDLDHSARRRVIFCGDLDEVDGVQQRDQAGLYVQRVWKCVRALFDYAELKVAGEFAGNVHTYLQSDTHDGVRVPSKWHAPTETQQTIDQWGAKRIFSVPTSVDSAGQMPMYAHFKIGQDNTFAPRMHYYDDVDKSGKIFIGYIGRHLINTKTKNA